MRRLVLAFAAAALASTVLPLVASAAGGGGRLQLTEAGGATFPNRAFVLSLPNARSLKPGQVQLTENGRQVIDLSVVPASQAAEKTFGVVLVVDASLSMRGVPIERAVAAERAVVARRSGRQQIAIVAFNNTQKVVLPLSSSQAKITGALASLPEVAYGTRLYDAVAKAEEMLSDAHISSGSIVVLSDGADTGSKATAAQVATSARSEHTRIFTVGLRSKSFRPHTLQTLAAAGGGSYALARTTADLYPLFDELGRRFSREYLLTYKSLSGPQLPIKVSVDVSGAGTATAAYRTPALAVTSTPPPPYKPSLASRFWGSWIVMVVLSLLAAAVVALLVYGLLRPRQSGLPLRMAEFVSVPGLQSRERRPRATADEGTDAEAPRPGLVARLDEVLEIAGIAISARRLIALTALGTAVAFVLAWLAAGSFWWALLALLVPPAVRSWVLWKLERRRNAFAEQLPDMLQVISSALRAGQSFAGAFAVVVESSGEPMKSEMQRVVADEQLGIPLEKSMAAVVKRMANRDLEQVALVVELQRETGGNSAEVVDRVAETVRGRFELRRLIRTLTAQGRMSRWIVTALPIALVALITLINPHYMHPLVSHLLGKVMIVLAVLLVIGGSLVIKKIVDIKV